MWQEVSGRNSIGSGWAVSSEKRGIEVDSGNQDGTIEKERSLEVGVAVKDLYFMLIRLRAPGKYKGIKE